jgi:hypothetical protein
MLFTWLCDQIIGTNSDEQQKSFGRHFEMEDELVSHITRRSIDLLKANYRASPTFPVYSLFRVLLLCLYCFQAAGY